MLYKKSYIYIHIYNLFVYIYCNIFTSLCLYDPRGKCSNYPIYLVYNNFKKKHPKPQAIPKMECLFAKY